MKNEAMDPFRDPAEQLDAGALSTASRLVHDTLSCMSYLRTLAALTLLLPAPLLTVAGCTATVDEPFAGITNPGGRSIGAPCAFDDQCATGRCSADVDAGTCGECVTIAALGHDCTGPHQGCSISAVCKGGVCQSVRKVEGEACSLGARGDDLNECDVELFCAAVGDWGEPGTCLRRTPLGESCGGGQARCILGAWCEHEMCVLPVPGTCNGARPWCGSASYCGDDLLCHPGTLLQNAACGIVDESFVDNECVSGLVCGNLEYPNGGGGYGTPSTCLPLPGKGEPCIHARCGEGLFCFRPPEGSTHPYCDSPRGEGEACSNDNYFHVACAAGLECRAKTCRVACQ
jgi:hypothetical protein